MISKYSEKYILNLGVNDVHVCIQKCAKVNLGVMVIWRLQVAGVFIVNRHFPISRLLLELDLTFSRCEILNNAIFNDHMDYSIRFSEIAGCGVPRMPLLKWGAPYLPLLFIECPIFPL